MLRSEGTQPTGESTIGYVTLGTNDIERAAKFYDVLLAELGASRLMDEETFILWATPAGAPGCR